ncbi:MAG: hypothetical protein Q8Q92_00860 [bacterium]|nr:hypothetical protein [bacterium]
MRILIATGIYPPEIGGPAEYAKNLKEVWSKYGHKVTVRVFSQFSFLPTGVRHLVYFCYILPAVLKADFILTLDTFSAALPSVLAAKMLGKKIMLRTGGDFLWESYVERTGESVLLIDFYKTCLDNFSIKERKVFKLIKFVLKNVNAIIWSTEWQKNIFMEPYKLMQQKHFIVENYYGPKVASQEPVKKNFIAATRKLKWKNIDSVKKVFTQKEVTESGAILDTEIVPHDEFLDKLSHSYAVIIASLGDISPNTILDAIRSNKPFILTRENGLYNRIKDISLFIDPQNPEDIKNKVLWLAKPENYEEQKQKIERFTFTHTWEEIGREYLAVYNSIK